MGSIGIVLALLGAGVAVGRLCPRSLAAQYAMALLATLGLTLLFALWVALIEY